MNDWNTDDPVAADKRYLWHPFNSMHDWCAPDHEPLILVEGHAAVRRDSRGREYGAVISEVCADKMPE